MTGFVPFFRADHPALPGAVLRRGARQLLGSGYVEDAAAPVPVALSERDTIRHDRAVRYFRWLDLAPRASPWEPQARLRAARVTTGGTGGIAALALAASGVGRLHCVDPDEVELSNLSRQVLYTEDDIGAPKADVAVARLGRLNRDIEVTGQRLRAAGAGDLRGLARDCDVLLLAADQPPAGRPWANLACLAAGRPRVDAGYHGPLVRAAAFVPGRGPCRECTRLGLRDDHARDGAGPDAPGGPARSGTRSARCPPGCPATWPPTWSSPCSPASRRSCRAGSRRSTSPPSARRWRSATRRVRTALPAGRGRDGAPTGKEVNGHGTARRHPAGSGDGGASRRERGADCHPQA
ncbi:MAG TPA: ThiF family adenylyltransferase [Trebonia sp.]|nr:ThiF family adenylyltransferase [Trebonia sp.]